MSELRLNDRNAIWHLHWVVFIWGFTAILGKLITLQALELVGLRITVAVFCLYLYSKYKKETLSVSLKERAALWGAGLVIAAHWITFYHAIKISNVSVTLACLSTGAFFVSIIDPILHRKKPVPYQIALGFVAVIGLSIIFNVELKFWQGMVTALLSAFLSALFGVLNGSFSKKHPPLVISIHELTGGGVAVLLFLLFQERLLPTFTKISWQDVGYLLVLGTVCTAFAFLRSVQLLKTLSPYTVALTINLEPVYGIILAVLIFGKSESMHSSFYLGTALILLTLYADSIFRKRIAAKSEMNPSNSEV